MLKRLLLASAALFVIGGFATSPVVHARETGIVGTLTKGEPHTISVMTASHEEFPVTVNANTRCGSVNVCMSSSSSAIRPRRTRCGLSRVESRYDRLTACHRSRRHRRADATL